MKNTDTNIHVHYENDKCLVPFLMTCENINFLGSERRGEIVFFKFAPDEFVKEAIEKFYKRTAIPLQPKDLMDSVERFKKEVYRLKNNNG